MKMDLYGGCKAVIAYGGKIILNLLSGICILIVMILITQVFLFTSFKIPSDSMYPRILTGDHILVSKPLLGARLFNIFTILRKEKAAIYRLPGVQKITHNDILVFNFPHAGGTWEKIEMNLTNYYIKCCIGLPGDSVQIVNGFYINNNCPVIGNVASQTEISVKAQNTFEESIYNTFPYDSLLTWNIHNFGPLYIPKKNDILLMDRSNYVLYRKLIEWEQNALLSYQDSMVYLNNKPLQSYQFQENYYFMAGDWGIDSQDSRYWGLLPEEYIVGKAWIIWKSIDPTTEEFRWNRFLRKIQTTCG